MGFSIKSLPWLPPAPADFTARCRSINEERAVGPALQALAGFASSALQASALNRAVQKAFVSGRDFTPLAEFRLGILSNGTYDVLMDELAPAAARHGVALKATNGPFDQIAQQAFDPLSPLYKAPLDAVLIAADYRWFELARPALVDDANARIDAALSQLEAVVTALRQHGRVPAILQTLATPPTPLFGNFDRSVSGSVRAMIGEVNARILALAAQTNSYVFDVSALSERVGTDDWFDWPQWAAHKLPFANRFNAAYADALGRLVGAVRGKARKCLVLDLDNTCWGGAIGDDGLGGIKIGQGSALGEAFLAVQQAALVLHSRGVILAVSSKNDDANARMPFREHPDMLLKEHHISVFQANWNDKASNLEAIAKTLNIGLDALVLLDDNPAERAFVRAALPMVGVPELPNDPLWFPWFLMSAGYFETVAFSKEDALRTASYATDALRAEVRVATRNLGEYLSSLEMRLETCAFDNSGRQRIVQLINKSNQFNLTTRRYTEVEIADAQDDPETFTLQARLSDRFGDMGMIGVVIGRPVTYESEPGWELDTWLMSCRVLGRRVEHGMLEAVIQAARLKGRKWILGLYKPTPKNGMVEHHYEGLGFTFESDTEDGARRFVLNLADHQSPILPFVDPVQYNI